MTHPLIRGAVDDRGLELFSIASGAPLRVLVTSAEVDFLAVETAAVYCPGLAVLAADGGGS